MDDKKFMRLAIEQAQKAKNSGEWPFGSVIVQGEHVIAENRCSERQDKTVLAHAELQAIDVACKKLNTNKLSDSVIYCTNEPCLMCAAAIFQAKIPRVVIGASRADLSHILRSRRLHIDDVAQDSGYEIEIVRGVLKDEIIPLFEDIIKS